MAWFDTPQCLDKGFSELSNGQNTQPQKIRGVSPPPTQTNKHPHQRTELVDTLWVQNTNAKLDIRQYGLASTVNHNTSNTHEFITCQHHACLRKILKSTFATPSFDR